MRLISEKCELCLTLVLVGQFIIHILVYWFSFNINKDIQKRTTRNFYLLISVDRFNVGQVTILHCNYNTWMKVKKGSEQYFVRQQTFKYWNIQYAWLQWIKRIWVSFLLKLVGQPLLQTIHMTSLANANWWLWGIFNAQTF